MPLKAACVSFAKGSAAVQQKVAEKTKKDLTAAKKAGKNKPAKKDPKVAALKKSFYKSMIAD